MENLEAEYELLTKAKSRSGEGSSKHREVRQNSTKRNRWAHLWKQQTKWRDYKS